MKREIPSDWTHKDVKRAGMLESDDWVSSGPANQRRPMTPLQALMECAPGEEPDASQLELLALRDTIADAIDRLDLRHKWVFEMHVLNRFSVRTLGEMMGLGKSYVHLLVQEAKAMLAEDLQDHPAIAAYLCRHDQDEDHD